MTRRLPRIALALGLVTATAAACPMPTRAGDVTVRPLPTHETGAWVGVTEDPAGQRFALHSQGGLYQLDDDGDATLLASPALMLADADAQPTSDFHDVAAMGGGRFVLIADNDGFLYDHNFALLTRHFCYEPNMNGEPWSPGPDPVPTAASARQRALSLDYDAANHRIIAQPRTFDEDTGETVAAHVASFDGATGLDQEWFEIGETELLAGGLIEVDDNEVILGQGTTLLSFDRSDRTLVPVLDLFGLVDEISGLSRTADGETVLVTDEAHDQLVEVSLDLGR